MNYINEVEKINRDLFGGRDVLAEAAQKINDMDIIELRQLAFIAMNRVGLLLKGRDYDNPLDALVFFSQAIDLVFLAYENVQMNHQANSAEAGNS
ncbi:MAG: hypothetical protein BWK76_25845 [Desulfobulbaceae bacterium A2]|nr:MAG: hypothetical protein BWK76_25845 [Desulfobulbaceae bacterium A2]